MTLDGVSCLYNYTFGLGAIQAHDMNVSNCHFDDTFNDNLYEVIGGRFGNVITTGGIPTAQNIVVRNSTFNRTQMIGDFRHFSNGGLAAGGSNTFTNNVLFENCQFNNTTSTTPSTSNIIAGIVNNGPLDTSFINCQFNDISGITVVNAFPLQWSWRSVSRRPVRT